MPLKSNTLYFSMYNRCHNPSNCLHGVRLSGLCQTQQLQMYLVLPFLFGTFSQAVCLGAEVGGDVGGGGLEYGGDISTFTLHPPHIPPAFRFQYISLAGCPTGYFPQILCRVCPDGKKMPRSIWSFFRSPAFSSALIFTDFFFLSFIFFYS